ncbi:MAG: hypothetical protein DRQ55_16775 [Planctomycetota bacterium]|nr:MAG: hypothetical protein DRQ55_16775 [Planctomycetota bacterium]
MHPILLIVDGEPRVFHALRRTLQREQLELMYAESGDDALEQLVHFPAAAVLADEDIPGMTGTQLLAIVRRRWPDSVRMLLTGRAGVELADEALKQGQLSRVFIKPCDDAELIVAIRESLQQRAAELSGRPPAAPPPSGLTTDTDTPTHAPKMTLGSDLPLPDMTLPGKLPLDDATPSEIQLDGVADDEDVDALLADLRRSLDDLAG